MGLLSFGQADRLAPHQKQSTLKRGNLGDFSIFHGGGLHKWNYYPCAPPTSPALHRLPGILHPSLDQSVFHSSSSRLCLSSPHRTLHLRRRSQQRCLCHTFSPLHMLICFSLFHYHYLRVVFCLQSFFFSIPSVGTVCGRMRCFNKSILSSSFEGGQWLMQEGGESTQTGEPCARTNTRAWINTLTRLAVCVRVCNTSVEMPASLHLTETVTLPGPDGKNSW